MKVCILCVGSYGDFAPYVALGEKLKAEGHEVTIGAHEKARALSERFSLNFRQIGGDLSLTTTPEESRNLFASTGFLKVLSIFKIMSLFYKVLDTHLNDAKKIAGESRCLKSPKVLFGNPQTIRKFSI
jgi:hypothetical protein